MIYAIRYHTGPFNRQEDARRQRTLSKALLLRVIQKETGRVPQLKDFSFGPHGKPYLPGFGIQYNITNCLGLICCAVHDTEIGIDAETIRPYKEALAKRVCTDRELAQIHDAENPALQFIRFWTLKEGYVKYTGDGLGYGPRNAEFVFQNGVPYKPCDFVHLTQQLRQVQGERFVISTLSETVFTPDIHFYPETDFMNP